MIIGLFSLCVIASTVIADAPTTRNYSKIREYFISVGKNDIVDKIESDLALPAPYKVEFPSRLLPFYVFRYQMDAITIAFYASLAPGRPISFLRPLDSKDYLYAGEVVIANRVGSDASLLAGTPREAMRRVVMVVPEDRTTNTYSGFIGSYFDLLRPGTSLSDIERDLGLARPGGVELAGRNWPYYRFRYRMGNVSIWIGSTAEDGSIPDGDQTPRLETLLNERFIFIGDAGWSEFLGPVVPEARREFPPEDAVPED